MLLNGFSFVRQALLDVEKTVERSETDEVYMKKTERSMLILRTFIFFPSFLKITHILCAYCTKRAQYSLSHLTIIINNYIIFDIILHYSILLRYYSITKMYERGNCC